MGIERPYQIPETPRVALTVEQLRGRIEGVDASALESLDTVITALRRNKPSEWSKILRTLSPLPENACDCAAAAIVRELEEDGWHSAFDAVITRLQIPVELFHTASARLVATKALKGVLAARADAEEKTPFDRNRRLIKEIFTLSDADERAAYIEVMNDRLSKRETAAPKNTFRRLVNSPAATVPDGPLKNPLKFISRSEQAFNFVLCGNNFQGCTYDLDHHKQETGYSCAAATLRMGLEAIYEFPVTEAEALEYLETTTQFGTPLRSFQRIEDFPQFTGLDAVVGQNGSIAELKRLLADGYIVFVNYSPNGPHYAVLFGISDEGIALVDPWLGARTSMSLEVFNRIWHGGYPETGITEKGYCALRRDYASVRPDETS